MQRTASFALLFLPIVVLLFIYLPTQGFFTHQFDDTYITYRYAINLAEGHGLVFNIGERTDSASSFLYTLVLSFFWLIHFHNLELVAGLLGILSLGAICVLTHRLAFHLSKSNNVSLAMSLCCGLNGLLSGWALSGMETVPWAALILLALYLIIIDASYIAITLTIAAAAFTRLEGIFLVLPYALKLGVQGNFKKEAAALTVLGLGFVGFYVIKHSYYNVWISHAFAMKKDAHYYQPAPRELIRLWGIYASLPVILSLPALLKKDYIAVSAYLAFSFVSIYFGPRSDWSRYSVHLVPIFYAFSAPTVAGLLSNNAPHIRRLTYLVLIAMLAQAVAATVFNFRNMSDLAVHQACREKLGRYISENVPLNEVIASSDLGMIAYAAVNHSFVDLIGLTSSDVLQNYQQGKSADSVLEQKHVTYIADTSYTGNTIGRFDMLLKEFPKVTEQSRYVPDMQHVEFTCTAPPNLVFVLTKIITKTQAGAPGLPSLQR